MLPVFLTYFAGGGAQKDTKRTLQSACGFVLGFTLIFIWLGAFAGFLGGLLIKYETVVNIVAGLIVVTFGLNYMGIINIRFLNKTRLVGADKPQSKEKGRITGFFSAVLFGIVFSIGWTPCVGMFLASALAKASQQGSVAGGILMLLCFSMGLGIPFLLSALLIEKLKTAFNWIKKHYKIINLVSGAFLVIIGILMMTGMMNRFVALLTF